MNASILQNAGGYIKIAALDHRGSLSKYVPGEKFPEFKLLCTEIFAPYVNAVLLDPTYSADAISAAKKAGLKILLSREESGYQEDVPGERTTVLHELTSTQLKEMGADAIKLLLYLNPDFLTSYKKSLNILKLVRDESQKAGLPLLVEPIIYEAENEIESADQIIQDLNPYADILKLQWIPNYTYEKASTWVLLSRGMPYLEYEQNLKTAKSLGAKGFAVGRAVWQEVSQYASWEEKGEFIKTTAANRMESLSKIFL